MVFRLLSIEIDANWIDNGSRQVTPPVDPQASRSGFYISPRFLVHVRCQITMLDGLQRQGKDHSCLKPQTIMRDTALTKTNVHRSFSKRIKIRSVPRIILESSIPFSTPHITPNLFSNGGNKPQSRAQDVQGQLPLWCLQIQHQYPWTHFGHRMQLQHLFKERLQVGLSWRRMLYHRERWWKLEKLWVWKTFYAS